MGEQLIQEFPLIQESSQLMVPPFKVERKQDLLQIHVLIGDFRCNSFNSWRLKCLNLHLNIPQVSLKILYIQVNHHILMIQYILKIQYLYLAESGHSLLVISFFEVSVLTVHIQTYVADCPLNLSYVFFGGKPGKAHFQLGLINHWGNLGLVYYHKFNN